MNILELDEAQGLVDATVLKYLFNTGWRKETRQCVGLAKGEHGWIPLASAECYGSFSAESAIRTVASTEGRSVQDLLREINPRLRPGLPSEAAREAHQGHCGRWIASRRGEYTHTMIVRFLRGMTAVKLQFEDHRPTLDPTEEIEKWSFWPCDVNGDKVRWPTNVKEEML